MKAYNATLLATALFLALAVQCAHWGKCRAMGGSETYCALGMR